MLVLMLLVLLAFVLVVVVSKQHRILFWCGPLLLWAVLPGRLLVVVVGS